LNKSCGDPDIGIVHGGLLMRAETASKLLEPTQIAGEVRLNVATRLAR
jgi:hypothetical protein